MILKKILQNKLFFKNLTFTLMSFIFFTQLVEAKSNHKPRKPKLVPEFNGFKVDSAIAYKIPIEIGITKNSPKLNDDLFDIGIIKKLYDDGKAKVDWDFYEGVPFSKSKSVLLDSSLFKKEVTEINGFRKADNIECYSALGHAPRAYIGEVYRIFEDHLLEIEWHFSGQSLPEAMKSKKSLKIPHSYWYPADFERICKKAEFNSKVEKAVRLSHAPSTELNLGELNITEGIPKENHVLALSSLERGMADINPDYLNYLNKIVMVRAEQACIAEGYPGASSFPVVLETDPRAYKKTSQILVPIQGEFVMKIHRIRNQWSPGSGKKATEDDLEEVHRFKTFGEKVPPLILGDLHCKLKAPSIQN